MSSVTVNGRDVSKMNHGIATITAAVVSVVVNHGLSTIPSRVFLTPVLLSLSNKYWVAAITSTQFTINVDLAPGSGTAIFNWYAQI